MYKFDCTNFAPPINYSISIFTEMVELVDKCVDAFRTGNKEVARQILLELVHPHLIFDHDSWGMTLIHHAAKNGWADICKLLVEHYDCDPLIPDKEGANALHWACSVGSVPTVEYLLSLSDVQMRINDKDENGDTPLHSACAFARLPVIEILLMEDFVDITEVDDCGRIPIERLTKFNCDILGQFSRKGIDWDTEIFVQPYFNVFMVGNIAAGKTTLAAMMIELARDIPSQHGHVSGIKMHTAGVSPTQCTG